MKHSRRQFFRHGAPGAAAAFTFPAVLRSAAARRDRPDLLFLWADQPRTGDKLAL